MNSKLDTYRENLKSMPVLGGPRVISLGFNKSGTTTLARCFEILGLTPVADTKSPVVDFKFLMDRLCFHNDYMLCLDVAKRFRSLHNRPWNVREMYQRLDEQFPNSLFILTERDVNNWWKSVERWLTVQHAGDNERVQRYLTHLGIDGIDRKLFIQGYERHNYQIRDYFSGRGNLLTINFEIGQGWSEICEFLGQPIPDIPFPHITHRD